mmetsp:Transcript_23046/g.91385  ORF Transcript_23046/g.91385 Transcript_23046/m.91385 type:complete len:491 (-) Transcript_23046:267-1739(-)
MGRPTEGSKGARVEKFASLYDVVIARGSGVLQSPALPGAPPGDVGVGVGARADATAAATASTAEAVRGVVQDAEPVRRVALGGAGAFAVRPRPPGVFVGRLGLLSAGGCSPRGVPRDDDIAGRRVSRDPELVAADADLGRRVRRELAAVEREETQQAVGEDRVPEHVLDEHVPRLVGRHGGALGGRRRRLGGGSNPGGAVGAPEEKGRRERAVRARRVARRLCGRRLLGRRRRGGAVSRRRRRAGGATRAFLSRGPRAAEVGVFGAGCAAARRARRARIIRTVVGVVLLRRHARVAVLLLRRAEHHAVLRVGDAHRVGLRDAVDRLLELGEVAVVGVFVGELRREPLDERGAEDDERREDRHDDQGRDLGELHESQRDAREHDEEAADPEKLERLAPLLVHALDGVVHRGLGAADRQLGAEDHAERRENDGEQVERDARGLRMDTSARTHGRCPSAVGGQRLARRRTDSSGRRPRASDDSRRRRRRARGA